jgi:phage tail protein X
MMFSQGSRYRNLPQSSPLNAEGERLLSKNLRLIPPTPGRFLHTVREGDRLDLLAFKYYGDATKWWQIADANPAPPFPIDLLDQRPMIEELLVLAHPDFRSRFQDLIADLGSLGEVHAGELSYFDETKPLDPDFLQSTVVVVYDLSPATRKNILQKIEGHGFHVLRAYAWTGATPSAEAFVVDDPTVKVNWQGLVKSLASEPGMVEVQSIVTEVTVRIVYNSGTLERKKILDLVKLGGFTIEPGSSTISRIGTKIVIPPNQIV